MQHQPLPDGLGRWLLEPPARDARAAGGGLPLVAVQRGTRWVLGAIGWSASSVTALWPRPDSPSNRRAFSGGM